MNRCQVLLPMLLIILFLGCRKQTLDHRYNQMMGIIPADSNTFCVNSLQLENGQIVFFGMSFDYPNGAKHYSASKLNANGDWIWSKSCSEFTGIPARNGGFIASQGNTITLYDQDGNKLITKTLPNISHVISNAIDGGIEMLQMSNNRIVIARAMYGSFFNETVGLTVYDDSLNLIKDTAYFASDKDYYCLPFRRHKMAEGPDHSILITGVKDSFLSGGTFLMKINGNTMALETYKLYTQLSPSSRPGSIAVNQDGEIFIAFTKGYKKTDFTLGIKRFSLDSSIYMLHTDPDGNPINTMSYSGFPKLGFISRIVPTSDGGFLMAGTCNQDPDYSFKSYTRILLIKVNAALQQQQMNILNTIYPSWGIDLYKDLLGEGYLISGSQQSFDNVFKMMVMRTDANGNL